MGPSIVEKYEQILAADPRSRIFVELARALLERGDHARAAAVCRQGLEHHPSSILGRVTWGRAHLLAGDARAAHDQFEIAIGIDPANPYAYNLVGEALVRGGLFREALPVLARAVELQPADPKVKAALEDARRRASGGTVTAVAAVGAPGAPAASPSPAAPQAPPAAAGRATQLAVAAVREPADVPGDGPSAVAPSPPELELERTERLDARPAQAEADKTEELTLRLSLGPLDDGAEEEEQVGLGELEEAPQPPPRQTPPALAREAPPARKGPPGPRTLLTMIPPGAPPPAPSATPAAPPAAADAAEAARIAAAYERELREKAAQAAAAEPPPPPRRRALVAAVALLAVGGAATGAYLYVDGQTRAQTAQRALVEARAGLARDTRASLQAAAEVLAAARRSPPAGEVRAQLASLAAQVAAVRAAEHGDAEARALALELADDPASGDGGLVARLLLSGKPGERQAAEASVLAASPGSAPLMQRVAGQLLVRQGQVESGRGRLRIAAQATPPLLGALCDLGDSYLAGGDPEAALPLFEAAVAAHPTHPRAVLGAAEARLALERPLDGTLAELMAVDADPGSAPPLQARMRFEVAFARVLAARGDTEAASRRLKLAAGALGESAGLEAARAGLLLDGRAFEQAEEAAARAVRLEPKSADHRVTLARARLGLHRYRAAYEALAGVDGRHVWLARGLALAGVGQHAQARAALEKTVRSGKMPVEAATAYALADLALGRPEPALSLLEKLAGAKTAGAAVHAAHAQALLALKRPEEAEAACRLAAERGPKLPDGPRCLGRLYLATGRPEAAVTPLEQALSLDKADPETARLLAQAKAPRPAPKRAPPPKPAPRRK